MQASQLPTKYPIPFAKSALAANINPIPTGSQIGVVGGAASLTDGFPPLTFLQVGAGGVPPWGRDFNGLFNQITAWIQFSCNAGAEVVYDSVFASQIGGYPTGALLQSVTTGNLWLNTVDNNSANPDTTSGTAGWVGVGFIPSIQNESYISADDTGTSNNIVLAPTPRIASYQKYQRFQCKIANTTTGSAIGAVTVNVQGVSGLLGAKNLVFADGSAPIPLMLTTGEVAMFVYDGVNFQLENAYPTLKIPIGSPTLFVRTDGNDNNTGLVNTPQGAMATVQAAINRASNIYALQGKVLTIQLGITGTYAPFQVTSTSGQLIIQGDVNNRANYIFAGVGPSVQSMLNVAGADVTYRGFTANNSTNVSIVGSAFGGSLTLDRVNLNQVAIASNFSAIISGPGGSIAIGAISIQGPMASAFNASQGNMSCASPVTMVNTPSFSVATAIAAYAGVVIFSNAGAIVNGSTGPRYQAFGNGVINTNSGNQNFFSGTSAGTLQSGGVYL